MKSCCIGVLAGSVLLLLIRGAWASDFLKLQLSRSLNQVMTEIRFTDRESDQLPYLSRILVLGDRMRMDFGQENQGFVLFDRAAATVWHISPSDRRMTGISVGKPDNIWPKGWALGLDEMSSEQGALTQVRVNDELCAEFKSAPILLTEAAMVADFRRALAGRLAKSWLDTPERLRVPCSLALDVHVAGYEYSRGLPLAIRYWDGRTRLYQGHDRLPAKKELFELPAGYTRLMINSETQGNAERRQPSVSHAR